VIGRVYLPTSLAPIVCELCKATAEGASGRLPEGWRHHKRHGADEAPLFSGRMLVLFCAVCTQRAKRRPSLVPAVTSA